jgi:hypothetical protein
MTPDEKKPVDHTLLSARIRQNGEGPEVFAVGDLRKFIKPPLAEQLESPTGPATCGTEVECGCFSVEGCTCHSVSYGDGEDPCPGYVEPCLTYCPTHCAQHCASYCPQHCAGYCPSDCSCGFIVCSCDSVCRCDEVCIIDPGCSITCQCDDYCRKVCG